MGSSRLAPILLLGDVHRPYHDRAAWTLLLKVGRFLKPTHLWILGDYVDFYSVSAHSKDPSRVSCLEDELLDARRGLRELEALGASDLVYLAGNHEDRLRRYLQDKAPELVKSITIPGLLGLDRWTYVPYRDYTKRGKLHLTHDIGNAGRYAAFKALDAFQHSVVSGHSHRLTYLVEGTCTGEHKLSATFGWLGDVRKIDYLNRQLAEKNWAHGFGIGYLDAKTGYVYLTPVPIIHGTCCVHGTLFTS